MRLTRIGTTAIRLTSDRDLALMLYGLAVFRDCVAAAAERWTLAIRLVDHNGQTFARMDAGGTMTVEG